MKRLMVLGVLAAAGCSTQPPAKEEGRSEPFRLQDRGSASAPVLTNGRIAFRVGRNGGALAEEAWRAGPKGIEPAKPLPNFEILWNGEPQTVRTAQYSRFFDLAVNSVKTTFKTERSGLDVSAELLLHPYQEEVLLKLQVSSRADGVLEVVAPAGVSMEPRGPVRLEAGKPGSWTLATGPVNLADFERSVLEEAVEIRSGRIIIQGSSEDQAALDAMLAMTRRSVPTEGPLVLGPFGATRGKYRGRVFWDADAWVFPALALIDPDRARRIPEFRLATREGSQANYAAWVAAGRPIGSPNARSAPRLERAKPSASALRVAWEAAPDGRELAETTSYYQEHVTATVCHMLEQAVALGLAAEPEVQEFRRLAAAYYTDRVKGNQLKGVMSLDESFIGDNDLYTNLAVGRLLGKPMKLPRDETTFLTFDGDPLMGYKQAAALLALFPLQAPEAEREKDALLNRFLGKATRNGPAMSLSLEALLLARARRSDEALIRWRESWSRYSQPPYYSFSERPQGGEDYFVTGAAGCINAVVYGFMGLRIDDRDPGAKPWKQKLDSGWWVSAEPNLPTKWESLSMQISIRGQSVTLQATRGGLSVR